MEPSVSPPFKDRRVGLVVFGVIQIVLGGLCLLLVPALILSQKLQSEMTGAPTDARVMVPGIIVYLVAAVSFVSLGIGSILCRRWARTLTLFLAWTWLLVGIFGIAIMSFVLPRALPQQGVEGAGAAVALTFIGLILFAIYIVMPAAFVVFYRSPHVRATCEARDPVARWTDSCPLPVLGAALSFALGALSFFLMPFLYKPVVPVFGSLVSGPVAFVLLIALGFFWAWLAWGIFRMSSAAWVASIVMIVVLGVSATITMLRVDVLELYRAMGYPEQQIELLTQFKDLLGPIVVGMTALSTVLMLAYMLWVKKHFHVPLVSNVRPE